MIEVKNLTKRYGLKTAVDHISFVAQEGEILGILGPNGAGKTSTMRMLTGFMPPTEGTATINGFDIINDSLEARRHVGYMPERVPIYPDMTVEEYTAFWAKLRGVSKHKQQVQAVLERVNLYDRRKVLVRSLSKGLRQRLGLAQTLVHNPKVIILDEPTIGIDPQQVIEVRETVRNLANSHTVLFSTHILSEAEQVCDRVLILNHGKIIATGTPAELRQTLYAYDSLFIQVKGVANDRLEQALGNIQGVKAIQQIAGGHRIDSALGQDIRQAVVKTITQSGWQLLELRPMAITLEDIFLKLVSQESMDV
jgi:ABC-2 type transport system ATP-binding protein